MTRTHCRVPECHTPPAPHAADCPRHKSRRQRHGDPHFTQWTTADPYDVDTVTRTRRPTPGLTRLERRLVAQRLTALGISAAEIARILGATPRTIHRWRTATRTEPAAP